MNTSQVPDPPPLGMTFAELVRLITVVNRCWHRRRDKGDNDSVARALRDKKLALQLELISLFGSKIQLVRDDDEHMALYSVRLRQPLRLSSGEVRHDAMHVPVERVREFLPKALLQEDSMTQGHSSEPV